MVEAREPSLLSELLTRKYQIRNCSGKIMERTAFQISLGEGDIDIIINVIQLISATMPTAGTTGGGWSTNIQPRGERITPYKVSVGITEILIRYLQKLPNGSAELLRQYQEQFPEGYKIYEQENPQKDLAALCRVLCANADNHEHELNMWRDYLKTCPDERPQEDLEQLRIVLYAIHQSNANEECESAIVKWQHYLDSPKDTMSPGFHSKIKLCLVVHIFLDQVRTRWDSDADPRRYRECAVKVFGYLQRFFPAILAMLYTQIFALTMSGDYSKAFEGGPGLFNRSWNCDEDSLLRNLENPVAGEPVIFPLDQNPQFQLGRHYYVRETCCGDVRDIRIPYSQAEQYPPNGKFLERYYHGQIKSLKQIQQFLETLVQEEQKQSESKGHAFLKN